MPSRDEILHAKILVVDDSADNVDLMLEILREAGYPMSRRRCCQNRCARCTDSNATT